MEQILPKPKPLKKFHYCDFSFMTVLTLDICMSTASGVRPTRPRRDSIQVIVFTHWHCSLKIEYKCSYRPKTIFVTLK